MDGYGAAISRGKTARGIHTASRRDPSRAPFWASQATRASGTGSDARPISKASSNRRRQLAAPKRKTAPARPSRA